MDINTLITLAKAHNTATANKEQAIITARVARFRFGKAVNEMKKKGMTGKEIAEALVTGGVYGTVGSAENAVSTAGTFAKKFTNEKQAAENKTRPSAQPKESAKERKERIFTDKLVEAGYDKREAKRIASILA